MIDTVFAEKRIPNTILNTNNLILFPKIIIRGMFLILHYFLTHIEFDEKSINNLVYNFKA